MNKIGLDIYGLSYSEAEGGVYALILGEKDSKMRLPVMIGVAEAQSIVLALDSFKMKRPLTHDLFKSLTDAYLINIKEVIIDRLHDGVFYAHLVCEQYGEVKLIDARTSDAVAVALRIKCPIYTTRAILDEAGVNIDDIRFDEEDIAKLQQRLDEAVEEEDFELAVKLRDEIKRIKVNNNGEKTLQ